MAYFCNFNFLFCVGVQPINNVVIILGGQQMESAIHIHVSILPQTPFPSRLDVAYFVWRAHHPDWKAPEGSVLSFNPCCNLWNGAPRCLLIVWMNENSVKLRSCRTSEVLLTCLLTLSSTSREVWNPSVSSFCGSDLFFSTWEILGFSFFSLMFGNLIVSWNSFSWALNEAF